MQDYSESLSVDDPADCQKDTMDEDMMIEDVTETKHMAQKAKSKNSLQARASSVEQDENTESSEGPTCGFRERRTIIEQLEQLKKGALMPSLLIDEGCAPVLLNFLRNLTDDQWREIQQSMKNNLTFEQLSMLCLKIVKIVTQTALKILLPALAHILGVNLEGGSKSRESQCSLTGSESSDLGQEERELLAREMKYWSKKMRENGSAGPQPESSCISTSHLYSSKRSQTSLQSAPPEAETPFTHPLKYLFGITRESLLQYDNFNTSSASSSQLTCAMVGELVNQLNSGLSVAIQASSGKCSTIMLAGEHLCGLEAGKKMALVALAQMQKLMDGFDGQAKPRMWEDVIEPLTDPLIDEVIDAFMDAVDTMTEDLKVLMNLTKKIKILRSQFSRTHQRDLKVSPGKEEPSKSLNDSGSPTSAVARNLQTLSSTDFQSKALAAVSSILIRKVSSASGVAPSSRPSSASPRVLPPVISAATGIIKTFVGDMKAIAGSTKAEDQLINDQGAGSSTSVFSAALRVYGHMRVKMNDFLTLFKPEQGMAREVSLQDVLDTLENISTVEIQLPSIQLSKVPSVSSTAPCQSDFDDSTQEVLSSLVDIYKTEVLKVENKISDVASPSDESFVAVWFVDDDLLQLTDNSNSQSLTTFPDMSKCDSKNPPKIKDPPHSVIDSGTSTSAKARKLQALSSPDFQSKALSAVSSILIRKAISASGVAPSSIHSNAESIVLPPVISAATGIIKTFVGDMEAIAGSTEAGDQLINDQDAGSSTSVFSAALRVYGHMRAKMNDFLTLFSHEQAMAEDAPLQDVLDILENISTVEIQLPSNQLSNVSSATKPLPSPCQSDLDDSTHEVLSSIVNIYKAEVSKVKSKLSVVASPSDESILASCLVDDVLLKVSDISASQSPSTSQTMRFQYSENSATLSDSIKKLSSKEFQTHAKEAISKVLLTSSNFLIFQESHTSLQNILQTGLSQDTASGIMDTFAEEVKTIFQSTIGPNKSVLLEKGVSEASAMESCDMSEASIIRITGSTPKISEEKLWSTAVAISTKLGEKVKDFLTGLKPSVLKKRVNASKVSSKETLTKILVNIQSEMSTSEQEEEIEGDREQVCQETPRTDSLFSTSSRTTHRSELENNLPGTPITDDMPNGIDTHNSTSSHMSVTDMTNMTSIVDTLMETVHPEMAGLSDPDHTTSPKDLYVFTEESVKHCLLPSPISSTSSELHQGGSFTSMLSHGLTGSSCNSASALKQSNSTSSISTSDIGNDTVSLATRVMVKEVMETASAAQYVDSGEDDKGLPQTYSCQQMSAKVLLQSSTRSGSMDNSDTVFPLISLMDSGKDDFLCLASILVLRQLSTIKSSVVDGPSQESVDMTAASQQLITQVLSQFCSASGCSVTEAYPQDLCIDRVLRCVNKDLLKEFNSCETLQAAMSTQDPAFDRVLVTSLTKHLLKGCSEASRPSSATDHTGQPRVPFSQDNADMEAQQSRGGFFHFPRINFKWANRRNKVSPAVQDKMPSTDVTLPLH